MLMQFSLFIARFELNIIKKKDSNHLILGLLGRAIDFFGFFLIKTRKMLMDALGY
jgi:hypothetical protein